MKHLFLLIPCVPEHPGSTPLLCPHPGALFLSPDPLGAKIFVVALTEERLSRDFSVGLI